MAGSTSIDPIVLEIVKSSLLIVTGVFLGWFGNYINNKYISGNQKTNINRDRLLKNIDKVEDILNLLKEFDYLDEEISRNEYRLELLDKETLLEEQELSFLEKEYYYIQRDCDDQRNNKNKLNELSSRLETIKSWTEGIASNLNKHEEESNKISQELEKFKIIQSDFTRRLINDDIGAVGLSIDPSGKLANYILELAKIREDKSRKYLSDKEAIKIRAEINSYFRELIKKSS